MQVTYFRHTFYVYKSMLFVSLTVTDILSVANLNVEMYAACEEDRSCVALRKSRVIIRKMYYTYTTDHFLGRLQ